MATHGRAPKNLKEFLENPNPPSTVRKLVKSPFWPGMCGKLGKGFPTGYYRKVGIRKVEVWIGERGIFVFIMVVKDVDDLVDRKPRIRVLRTPFEALNEILKCHPGKKPKQKEIVSNIIKKARKKIKFFL
jgi:hypothetical protein